MSWGSLWIHSLAGVDPGYTASLGLFPEHLVLIRFGWWTGVLVSAAVCLNRAWCINICTPVTDPGALLAKHNDVDHNLQLCSKLLNLLLWGMTSESGKLRQINCRTHMHTRNMQTNALTPGKKNLYLGLKHIRTDRCCITPVECFEWKELWVQLNVNVLATAKYSRVIKKSFRTAVTTGIRIHNLQTNAHYREFEVMTKKS